MKMMLKVLALPVLFVVKAICILGNLLTNISSYVIGVLLLVIVGCAIYCIVQAMWTSLAILTGMGLAAILAIFLLIWVVVKAETVGASLGEFISSYECDPKTADEEFLLSKRQYQHTTGREQKNNIIAYQIRQSFKPGEITPEEANQVGYKTAIYV